MYTAISHIDAKKKIKNDTSIIIFDTRTALEFRDHQLPNSVNVSMFNISDYAKYNNQSILVVGNDKSKHVLQSIISFLMSAKFKKIFVLNSSVDTWFDINSQPHKTINSIMRNKKSHGERRRKTTQHSPEVLIKKRINVESPT